MKANIKKALTGIVLLAMLLTAILPYTAMAITSDTNAVSLDDGDDHGTDYVTGENLLGAGITTTIPASYFTFEVEGQESYTPADFTGIASGTLSGNVPTITIDGTTYKYEYAYLDGNTQKKVTDVVMYNDSVYYRLGGDYVAAVKLGTGKQITLKYSIPFDQYDVTYKSATTTALIGKFDGAAKAPETKDADSFTAYYTMPATVSKVAFTITRANADGTTTTLTQYKDAETAYDYKVVSEEGGSRYDIVINKSAITGALTIAATETAKTTYTITLTGSNSAYKETSESSWTGLDGAKSFTKASASGSFYLHGRYEWSQNGKALNKISAKIGSSTYMLNLPETAGTSAVTTVSGNNGDITITVARSTDSTTYNRCSTPTYTITIANCYQDISIDVNFQDTNSKELWLVGLDGVKPIYSVSSISGSGWTDTTSHIWSSGSTSFINSENFGGDLTFYVAAQDGYEFKQNADGTYAGLTVTAYNEKGTKQTPTVALKKLETAQTIDGVTYEYYFTIDTANWHGVEDETETVTTTKKNWWGEETTTETKTYTFYRWTIDLKATPKTSTYTVHYDLNNGTGTIADQTVATATSAFTVTTTQPTLEGKYFAGWTATLKADDKGTKATTTLYPGSATHFDLYDATETKDATTGVYNQTITLKATWSDVPVNLETAYTIKVIVHDRTGEYMQYEDAAGNTVQAVVDLEEKGYPGDELYIPLSALESKVIDALNEMGFTGITTLNGLYTEDLVDFEINKLPGGIKQIDFYQYATVNYKVVTEGSTEVGGTVSPTTNTFPIKAQADTSKVVPSSTATANDDFVFVGWYSDADCTKLVTEDATITTTMPDGGWPEAALTFYAKFKPNTTTVTVYKTVSGSVPSDKTKTYNFTYTINGVESDDYKFSITGNGTATIKDVQIGSELVITETDNDLYDTSYKINYGSEKTGSVATIDSVAKGNTVEFINTRKTATLTIVKNMNSIVPSDLTSLINFKVNVYDGETKLDALSQAINVQLSETATANTATGSTTITVPVGTKVEVIENLDNKDWYTTTVDGNNDVITFTNTRKTQDVTIQKQVESDLPSDKNKEFTINYTYGEGSDETEGSFTLKADKTGTVKVPYGMTISVSEKLTGTDATTYDPYYSKNGSDYDQIRDETTSQITVPSKNVTTLYVKNVRKTQTINLTKQMSSTVPSDLNKTFTFKVDTYDGDTVALTKTVSIDLSKGTKDVTDCTAKTTVDVYVGTKVVVTEQIDEAESTYYTTKYSIAGGTQQDGAVATFADGISPAAATDLTFYNERNCVDVKITKNIENAISKDDCTSYAFAYTIGTGTDKVADTNTSVAVAKSILNGYYGETTIPNVPVGLELTVTETLDADDANTFDTKWSGTNGNTALTGDSTTTATIAAVNAGGATLNFTNTRKNATITISKKMTSIVDADMTKDMEFIVNVIDVNYSGAETTLATKSVKFKLVNGEYTDTTVTAPVGTKIVVSEYLPEGEIPLYTTTVNGVEGNSATVDSLTKDGATFAFTNTRKTAYIRIDKKATAGILPESLVTSYDFNVVAYDGTTVLKTYDTQTITIDSNGKGSSNVIEVPYMSKVVITEDLGTDAQYFDTTNDNDNGGKVATIASAENTTSTAPKAILFTNTRKMVNVTLNKEVVNGIPADKYTYSFTCTYYGASKDVKDEQFRTFSLDDNYKGIKQFQVPVGYTLVVRENPSTTVPLSTYSISWTAKSGETDLTNATGDTYTVASVGLGDLTLNCTNTRLITSFTVSKQVITYGSVTCDEDKNASFAWQYSLDGGTNWVTATTNLTHGNSVTIDGIPIGTTVLVKEAMTDAQAAMYNVANDRPATANDGSASFTLVAEPTSNTVTFTNTRKKGNVDVKMVVSGNFGDTSKDFRFSLVVIKPDGTKESLSTTLSSKKSMDISVLKNLPYGTDVTIEEHNYTSEGYVGPTITVSDPTPTEYRTYDDANGYYAEFKVSEPSTVLTFTNTRNVEPDTGVLLDSLPYVLILLLVVGIGTLVFIRRRRHSDD